MSAILDVQRVNGESIRIRISSSANGRYKGELLSPTNENDEINPIVQNASDPTGIVPFFRVSDASLLLAEKLLEVEPSLGPVPPTLISLLNNNYESDTESTFENVVLNTNKGASASNGDNRESEYVHPPDRESEYFGYGEILPSWYPLKMVNFRVHLVIRGMSAGLAESLKNYINNNSTTGSKTGLNANGVGNTTVSSSSSANIRVNSVHGTGSALTTNGSSSFGFARDPSGAFASSSKPLGSQATAVVVDDDIDPDSQIDESQFPKRSISDNMEDANETTQISDDTAQHIIDNTDIVGENTKVPNYRNVVNSDGTNVSSNNTSVNAATNTSGGNASNLASSSSTTPSQYQDQHQTNQSQNGVSVLSQNVATGPTLVTQNTTLTTIRNPSADLLLKRPQALWWWREINFARFLPEKCQELIFHMDCATLNTLDARTGLNWLSSLVLDISHINMNPDLDPISATTWTHRTLEAKRNVVYSMWQAAKYRWVKATFEQECKLDFSMKNMNSGKSSNMNSNERLLKKDEVLKQQRNDTGSKQQRRDSVSDLKIHLVDESKRTLEKSGVKLQTLDQAIDICQKSNMPSGKNFLNAFAKAASNQSSNLVAVGSSSSKHSGNLVAVAASNSQSNNAPGNNRSNIFKKITNLMTSPGNKKKMRDDSSCSTGSASSFEPAFYNGEYKTLQQCESLQPFDTDARTFNAVMSANNSPKAEHAALGTILMEEKVPNPFVNRPVAGSATAIDAPTTVEAAENVVVKEGTSGASTVLATSAVAHSSTTGTAVTAQTVVTAQDSSGDNAVDLTEICSSDSSEIASSPLRKELRELQTSEDQILNDPRIKDTVSFLLILFGFCANSFCKGTDASQSYAYQVSFQSDEATTTMMIELIDHPFVDYWQIENLFYTLNRNSSGPAQMLEALRKRKLRLLGLNRFWRTFQNTMTPSGRMRLFGKNKEGLFLEDTISPRRQDQELLPYQELLLPGQRGRNRACSIDGRRSRDLANIAALSHRIHQKRDVTDHDYAVDSLGNLVNPGGPMDSSKFSVSEKLLDSRLENVRLEKTSSSHGFTSSHGLSSSHARREGLAYSEKSMGNKNNASTVKNITNKNLPTSPALINLTSNSAVANLVSPCLLSRNIALPSAPGKKRSLNLDDISGTAGRRRMPTTHALYSPRQIQNHGSSSSSEKIGTVLGGNLASNLAAPFGKNFFCSASKTSSNIAPSNKGTASRGRSAGTLAKAPAAPGAGMVKCNSSKTSNSSKASSGISSNTGMGGLASVVRRTVSNTTRDAFNKLSGLNTANTHASAARKSLQHLDLVHNMSFSSTNSAQSEFKRRIEFFKNASDIRMRVGNQNEFSTAPDHVKTRTEKVKDRRQNRSVGKIGKTISKSDSVTKPPHARLKKVNSHDFSENSHHFSASCFPTHSNLFNNNGSSSSSGAEIGTNSTSGANAGVAVNSTSAAPNVSTSSATNNSNSSSKSAQETPATTATSPSTLAATPSTAGSISATPSSVATPSRPSYRDFFRSEILSPKQQARQWVRENMKNEKSAKEIRNQPRESSMGMRGIFGQSSSNQGSSSNPLSMFRRKGVQKEVKKETTLMAREISSFTGSISLKETSGLHAAVSTPITAKGLMEHPNPTNLNTAGSMSNSEVQKNAQEDRTVRRQLSNPFVLGPADDRDGRDTVRDVRPPTFLPPARNVTGNQNRDDNPNVPRTPNTLGAYYRRETEENSSVSRRNASLARREQSGSRREESGTRRSSRASSRGDPRGDRARDVNHRGERSESRQKEPWSFLVDGSVTSNRLLRYRKTLSWATLVEAVHPITALLRSKKLKRHHFAALAIFCTEKLVVQKEDTVLPILVHHPLMTQQILHQALTNCGFCLLHLAAQLSHHKTLSILLESEFITGDLLTLVLDRENLPSLLDCIVGYSVSGITKDAEAEKAAYSIITHKYATKTLLDVSRAATKNVLRYWFPSQVAALEGIIVAVETR